MLRTIKAEILQLDRIDVEKAVLYYLEGKGYIGKDDYCKIDANIINMTAEVVVKHYNNKGIKKAARI